MDPLQLNENANFELIFEDEKNYYYFGLESPKDSFISFQIHRVYLKKMRSKCTNNCPFT